MTTLRERVMERDRGCCRRCGVLYGVAIPATDTCHAVPKSRGGHLAEPEEENCWAGCRSCHNATEKKDDPPWGVPGSFERRQPCCAVYVGPYDPYTARWGDAGDGHSRACHTERDQHVRPE